MLRRTPVFTLLLLTLVAANGFSSDDKKQERPIEPTPTELASYELPPPESEVVVPPSKSAFFEFTGAGVFAASAADFATTEWGLARGLEEGNPLAAERGIRLVHHVVGPAAVYWTTEHLQKKGKTKLALGLRIAIMAAYTFATFHNVHQVSSITVSP